MADRLDKCEGASPLLPRQRPSGHQPEHRLKDLREADDPEAVHDRLIEETALLEGVSGLGLARIRAQAGLDFDYAIEGNELTIVVHAPLAAPLHH